MQQLIGISYALAESRKVLADHPESDVLEGHRQAVLAVAKGLRHLIGGLRPLGLEELGLEVALKSYTEQLKEQRDLNIETDIRTSGYTFPAPVALCLFRTAQEALRNTLKHADAGHVSLVFAARGQHHSPRHSR